MFPSSCFVFQHSPYQDTWERLSQDVALAERLGVCFGIKLVRGAYLEKERQLAREKGYPDPVQLSWEATNER